MAVMSPTPIPVLNGTITYDFRNGDSYMPENVYGIGQKEISPNVWGMFAGEAAQTNPYSYDINGFDKLFWVNNNGAFTSYEIADFNLDGDVSGPDKNILSENNGIYSGVPKPQL